VLTPSPRARATVGELGTVSPQVEGRARSPLLPHSVKMTAAGAQVSGKSKLEDGGMEDRDCVL
jgi:hypothetical protein